MPVVVLALVSIAAFAQRPPATAKTGGLPAQEDLRYSVNWPSGLSLGEAQMTSKKQGDIWQFTFSIEAAVPGFQVMDLFRSTARTALLCSDEFEKDMTHGRRKTREKTTFDGQRGTATRQTLPSGGKSEIETGSCARDALTFLYFVRQELAQGRITPAQTVYFGAPYRVRIEYSGNQAVRIGDERVEADRITASLKGPKSETTIEVFFARDAGRTPVQVKVPLSLGTFSMELAR